MSPSRFDAQAALEKFAKLDARTKLMMELVAKGQTPKDIAAMRRKSFGSVRDAITRTSRELGIRSKLELRCVIALSKYHDKRMPIE